MPLSAGDKLGSCEIVSAIGKGGMGEMWRARDPQSMPKEQAALVPLTLVQNWTTGLE
jgi:hypothetical protein